jgi:quercetin dioxygenase-like cupin family protein
MLPGKESPFHRTSSIDYGIVMEGEVELELDNGVKKTVGAGGIIVQRGTMHAWRNPSSDTICRIVFILIESKGPYLHNGQSLDDLKPEDVYDSK